MILVTLLLSITIRFFVGLLQAVKCIVSVNLFRHIPLTCPDCWNRNLLAQYVSIILSRAVIEV